MIGIKSNARSVINGLARLKANVTDRTLVAVQPQHYRELFLSVAREQLERRTEEEEKPFVQPILDTFVVTAIQRGMEASMSGESAKARELGKGDLSDDENALLYSGILDWVEQEKDKDRIDTYASGERKPSRVIAAKLINILKNNPRYFDQSSNTTPGARGLKAFLTDRGLWKLVEPGQGVAEAGLSDARLTELLAAVLEAWHDVVGATAERRMKSIVNTQVTSFLSEK